jgi:hypothetical protein
METNSLVEHPQHYCYGKVELIDLIENLPFSRGCIIKYVYRAGHKESEPELKDLKKALWYLQREIARLENIDK